MKFEQKEEANGRTTHCLLGLLLRSGACHLHFLVPNTSQLSQGLGREIHTPQREWSVSRNGLGHRAIAVVF